MNGLFSTTSLLEKTITNPSYRDILLKIGQLCPEFSLISTFDNQESMRVLTEAMTLQVIDSMSASFVQTGSLKEINMIEWPTDKSEFTFMSETVEVTKEKLEELLKGD